MSDFLKVGDVAAKLQVTTDTVRTLVRKGELPAPIQLGGSQRWDAAELDAFIKSRKGK
ncbi:helix-turn-helix transcriptional regulator [Lacipirellula sp.]|uniref:helix-turn-helix transcriptional regulator n=1 Tax=Lacipirellula sp. TaxID=2691419 RepID=UPI003D107AE2